MYSAPLDFPWMLALSADQDACAQNLMDAAPASFSTRQPHLAIAELTSWRKTATASAVPEAWQRQLHGWPGHGATDLVRQAALAARRGAPDAED